MQFGKKRKGYHLPEPTGQPFAPAQRLSPDRVARMLELAAWKDPTAGARRAEALDRAVQILERAAACTDMAVERLGEALDAMVQGQTSTSFVMRGLLSARVEELLDSLERIAIMARDGSVNLLDGGKGGLEIEIESEGFRYALNPINIRRGPAGLHIPVLMAAFEDEVEAAAMIHATRAAMEKVGRFAARLSEDATILASLVRTMRGARETAEAAAALGRETLLDAGPPPVADPAGPAA